MNKNTVITVLIVILILFLSSAFICAETTGNYVYVGNPVRYSSISVVDIGSNTILKTIRNVYGPAKIFVSPNGLQSFVVENGTYGRDTFVIDNVTHTVAKPKLEGMAQVKTITISPDSSKAFIAAYNPYQAWTGGNCRFGGGIHTFDTSTYQHLSCFGATESYADAMSVRPDGKYLYADFYYNRDTTIGIYDTGTLSHVKSLYLNKESHSYHRVNGMAQGSSGKYLYVTGRSWVSNDWCPCDASNFGYLYTIDMLTNEVINTLTVPVSQFDDLEISPDGQYTCVIDETYKKLYIVNLNDYTFRSINMGEHIYDRNLRLTKPIISPDSKYAYLLKLETFKVAVIDLNNAAEVYNIDLSNKPYQMIMTPDGNYIYVTIPNSNIVSVIDTVSNTIIKNISGFSYPSPIAFVSIKNNPPQSDAGDDLIISSQDQNSIVIQGSATDPDGDTLSYRWLKDGEEILPWELVGIDGNANLDLSTAPYFSAGEYLLTLEADDGQITAIDSMTLTIGNSKPIVSAAGAGTYSVNTPVTLNGQVSDFDGDLLSYQWLDGDEVLFEGNIQTDPEGLPKALLEFNVDNLNLGIHKISLIVSDGTNESVTSNINVEVIDSIAPTLVPVTNKQILWPPNHSMVDIVIEANAFDNAGDPVMLSAAIYSNEAENGLGDGDTAPDWTEPQIDQTNGIINFQLRAERMGAGNAREYTVIITASDESDNISETDIKYVVPHDKRK